MASTFTPMAAFVAAALFLQSAAAAQTESAESERAPVVATDDPFGDPNQNAGSNAASDDDPFGDSSAGSDPFGGSPAADNPFGDAEGGIVRRGRRTVTQIIGRASAGGDNKASEADANPSPTGVVDLSDSSPNEKRIRAALRSSLKAPLEFIGEPLESVVQQLQVEYDVPILFDTAAIDAAGVSPDQDINLSIRNITLGAALQLMLQQLEDLTCLVENDVLLITTTDAAEKKLDTRVYDISSLGFSAEELAQRVPKVVAPGRWNGNGSGEGDIVAFGNDAIAVLQTQSVHEDLIIFLEQLYRFNQRREADETGRYSTDPGYGRGGRGGRF